MARNSKRNRRQPKRSQGELNKLKLSAYELVVIQDYTQKEAANILGVSEVTMSQWACDGQWRNEKKARQSTSTISTDNLKKIILLLSDRRLEIEDQINDAIRRGDSDMELELRKQASSVSDEISKHNKTLQTIQKESKVTLGIYIDVMDDIFDQLRNEDPELWEKTIEFQGTLIRKKTNELG